MISTGARKILAYLIIFLVIILAALANWRWPLYNFLGDKLLVRFVWLGIFFVLLDISFEIFGSILKELFMVREAMSFAKNLKKISKGFRTVAQVSLANNRKADFVIVGSSGIWLLEVKLGDGKLEFNGDDIIQDGATLKGLIGQLLEKSYSLNNNLNKRFGRDFSVTPVIVFSNHKINTDSIPKKIREVYISSGSNAVALIEDTDVQLIDQNTTEEIYNFLKNGLKTASKPSL